MSNEVIMPALGMSQDTGVLAEWLKQPGEYVKAGEPLMAVETDKAIQEVEAAESGYLSHVAYNDGAEVPVGEVMAKLTAEPEAATADQAPSNDDTTKAPEPDTQNADTHADRVDEPRETANAMGDSDDEIVSSITDSTDENSQSNERAEGVILASAKARKMAYDAGITLQSVLNVLNVQPLHAKDIQTYLASPQRQEASAQAHHMEQTAIASSSSNTNAIQQRVYLRSKFPSTGIKDCQRWLGEQRIDSVVNHDSLLVAFMAAHVWRSNVCATDDNASIQVQLSRWQEGQFVNYWLDDPDQVRFSHLSERTQVMTSHDADGVSKTPTITIIDMRDTPIMDFRPPAGKSSMIVITEGKRKTTLSFYGGSEMASEQAVAFMANLTDRLRQPLVHVI